MVIEVHASPGASNDASSSHAPNCRIAMPDPLDAGAADPLVTGPLPLLTLPRPPPLPCAWAGATASARTTGTKRPARTSARVLWAIDTVAPIDRLLSLPGWLLLQRPRQA